MCGIAGYISDEKFDSNIAMQMCDKIKSRGPDDFGIWTDYNCGIHLTHRRLSILDLSEAGSQPMISKSGRYVIAYNGEIYNHMYLRKEIEKKSFNPISWRGFSDTETLLQSIEFWGLFETLKKAVGMFAFTIWDRKEKHLYLVRDRIGEKPLYYGFSKNVFLFASELKSIKVHPAFNSELDINSIGLQQQFGYVPSPHTIYKNINKLDPGTILKIDFQNGFKKAINSIEKTKYWSIKNSIIKGKNNPFLGNSNEAAKKLDSLLTNSIKQQMISDVSLGAFLSGGIDSSAVVALMQAQSTSPIKTFTLGFNERVYDESVHAKKIANHFGTDHHEIILSSNDVLSSIPSISSIYDEPFSDSSQIPTYLISKFAKNYVTVSLSGDGGDEIFGGYNRYLFVEKFWHSISFLPLSSRKIIKKILKRIPNYNIEKFISLFQFLLSKKFKNYNIVDKIQKILNILDSSNINELYMRLISHWTPEQLLINKNLINKNEILKNFSCDLDLNHTEKIMAIDSMIYLPDDILVKTDRASMSVSLENRSPFLDYRIFEYSWSLPKEMKIYKGKTKWILREVLKNYLPIDLIERPKMGFGLPLDIWLRTSLRDWAEELLNENKLKNQCFFDVKYVRKKWSEHISGEKNWHNHIWNILMFQSWYEKNHKI